MQTIHVKHETYRLHCLTGIVTGLGKDFILYTISHSRKTRHASGSGLLPVIRVETTTRSFNHIFLTTGEGEEVSLEIHDFAIACREGHELTAFRIITGEKENPFAAVWNKTTGHVFFSEKEMPRIFRQALPSPLISGLLFLVCGWLLKDYITGLAAFLLGCIAGKTVADMLCRKTAGKFMQQFRNATKSC